VGSEFVLLDFAGWRFRLCVGVADGFRRPLGEARWRWRWSGWLGNGLSTGACFRTEWAEGADAKADSDWRAGLAGLLGHRCMNSKTRTRKRRWERKLRHQSRIENRKELPRVKEGKLLGDSGDLTPAPSGLSFFFLLIVNWTTKTGLNLAHEYRFLSLQ
jgi:hypothetical protein